MYLCNTFYTAKQHTNALTLGLGVFYARYFQRHIREDTAAEAARLARH